MISLSACNRNKDLDLSFLEKYTDEEIEHFLAVGFSSDRFIWDRKTGYVTKWDSDIRIKLHEPYSANEEQMLEEFINTVSPLLNGISITRVDSNANVFVLISDPPGGYYSGLTKRSWVYDCITRTATVWVAPINQGQTRKYTLYHELLHVIGFDDPNLMEYTKGIFGVKLYSVDEYDDWLKYFTLPELAKSAIEILYNENIPIGLKKEDFIREQNSF